MRVKLASEDLKELILIKFGSLDNFAFHHIRQEIAHMIVVGQDGECLWCADRNNEVRMDPDDVALARHVDLDVVVPLGSAVTRKGGGTQAECAKPK